MRSSLRIAAIDTVSKNPSAEVMRRCVAAGSRISACSSRFRLTPVQRVVLIRSPPGGFEMHDSVANTCTGSYSRSSSSVNASGRWTIPPIRSRQRSRSIRGARVFVSTR